MPLCLSSGEGWPDRGGGWLRWSYEVVDLSGDVELREADALAAGFALGGAAVKVVARPAVAAQPGQRDAVEGGVGLPVAASVEPVSVGSTGGCLHWARAAQRGEGRLGGQSFGVVAGGDEQGGGAVRADAAALEQVRRVVGEDLTDPAGEVVDLAGQVLDAVGEHPQGVHDGGGHVPIAGGVGQLGAAADQGGA